MTDNKQYIINIGDHSEMWDADMYAQKSDALYAKYKDANVFEVEDVEDFDEDPSGNQYVINIGDHSEIWDADMVKEKGSKLKAAYPDAMVQRVSYKDYWGEQADVTLQKIAELEQPDPERAAKLAELGYYDDTEIGFDMTRIPEGSVGLMPLSTAMGVNSVTGETTYNDPRVEEFMANDSAQTDRQQELARLRAQYDSNPQVIARREWEAQNAQDIDSLMAQINEDMKTEVDAYNAAQGAAAKHGLDPYGANMTTQAIRMIRGENVGQDVVENEKLERYQSAIKLLQMAKDARESKFRGIGGGVEDVTQNWFRDAATQSDSEMYREVGSVLKQLEERLGSLNEITDEVIEQNLSPDEKALILAFFKYNQAVSEAAPHQSRWYKGARVATESIPFMLEFLVTGGAAKGVERAAQKVFFKGMAKWIGKRTAAKVSKVAAVGLANATFRTIVAPSTLENVMSKTVEYGKDGHLHRGKQALVGVVDSYIEQLSEMSGGMFGKILGTPFRAADKMLGKFNLGSFRFSKLGKWFADTPVMQNLGKLGFQGMPEEMAEEVFGNALRTFTGVDKEALSRMFEKDELASMVIGFAPMTLFGAGMSAGKMAAVSIGASNAESRMRKGLAPTHTTEQLDMAIGAIQAAETPNDVVAAIRPIIGGMKSGGASKEELALVWDYVIAETKKKAMISANTEKDRKLAESKIAQAREKAGDFWINNEDGTRTVRQVTLNDGREVFVLSQPDATGNMAVIESGTGKKGMVKAEDIKEEIWTGSLQSYGAGLVMADRKAKERERMDAERKAQIDNLRAGLEVDPRINMGTLTAPNYVVVDSMKQNGVTYISSTGKKHSMSWDEVANRMGTPIKVETDQEIALREAKEIADRAAQKTAQRAKADAVGAMQTANAAQNAETANAEVAAIEKTIPMKDDGTVDETAFWENDPEGYLAWNDEQQQDGGVDSFEQIGIALNELSALHTQLMAAQNTSDPSERKKAKAEAAAIAEKMARLQALQDEYAERLKTPEQKRMEVEEAIKERVEHWKAKTGIDIVVVENPAQVTNPIVRRVLANGQVFSWAEVDKGVAYMYLPAIESVEMLDEKFAHEVVTHIGLKKLLGEQGYTKFMQEVWNMMSDAAKRHFLAYANVKGNQILAAEEYVAHIAEKMGVDVTAALESLTAEEKTVWERIVDMIMAALEALGLRTEVLTEQDLVNMIRNTYANLEAGNEQTQEKTSAARAQIEALQDALTMEEIAEVAQNDLAIAQQALEDLKVNAPKVEKGESSTAFVERKKAYTEQLNAAQAEYDARLAVANEVASMMAPAAEQMTPEEVEQTVEAERDTMVDENGNPLMENMPFGGTMLSSVTFDTWTDNLGNEHKGTKEMVLERMKKMGFSKKDIALMKKKMQTAYEYIEKLRTLTNPDGSVRFQEFNAWAEKTPLYKVVGRDFVKAITSLVSNGDYPINLELTTDCIKREAFTQLLNALVKRGAVLNGMGPGEIVVIQKMMKQYGIQVACALCFVEGKRLQIVNWASQIVEDWNNALVEAGVETEDMFEFGKDGDAFIPAEEWRTYEDKPRLAKMLRTIDEVGRLFQGIDPETFERQKAENKRNVAEYIREKAAKSGKPVSEWKPSDEQAREIKKLKHAGLAPLYVNENMKEYNEAFEQMRNEWLEENEGADPLSFTPTKKQWEALEKIRNRMIDNVKAKMVRLIMEYPEMRKKMTINDLLGSKGLMEIRQQHGAAYEQLYSIILQRFGTGTPKPVQDAVPYDGEVMTLSESAFKNANKIGGARLFSFSDFDITKVFDYMQMFFDLEANKQMLQSYTKEVGAVLLFGRSNAKFNISTLATAVVPAEVQEEFAKAGETKRKELMHKWAENAGLLVDEQGNITGISFSDEHSVSPDFAKQIFHDDTRNKDCGAIMVGASVNHAIYSAAQDWIRMVIPFHLSGMPIAAREKTDVKWWTDNTAYQSTRKKTKEGWKKISGKEDTFEFYADMHEPGWNMRDKAREYLDWCKKQGFRPKFDWGINSDYYRAYCEEQGYTPNQQIIDMMDAQTTNGVWDQYYKFLTDFTAYKPVFNEEGEMIDEIPSPQQRVVTNFDMTDLEREVIFEGENSMLARREGNIALADKHMNTLADMTMRYLNGEITEEEMGLRDDVYFDSKQDADAYLDALAAEGATMLSAITPAMDKAYTPHEASLDEIDEMFKEYNADQDLAALYDKVSALAHTMGLKIKFDNPWSNAAGTTVADKVKFNSMFMDSPYQPAEKKAHAILHELIHATTQYAIQAKKAGLLTEDMTEAVNQLDNIYDEIKADPAFEGMKGAESVHEMVAELANPEFRATLKEKNLFQQIVDAIKRLLGIETGENALDNLSSTLDYILENFDADAYRKYVDVAQRNEGYIRFSARTDEARTALFEAAKKEFGTTNNFAVAGYMLPDGTLLDFSEEGAPANMRTLDHREIEGVIMEEGKEYDNRWEYLADFMNEGAIRLLPEYAGINLMKAPTKEQRQRLFDFIYKYNGEVILEIADERLNNVAYVEYDRRTSPARIFRDIDGYFNEGIIPQQDIRFSIANEKQAIFVSNAAKAVESIKMEKATPAQWLAMIEKNGGLKAGEDKWMGLSDWLKASDKKTLTKAEVLEFVNEHAIKIEETHYDAYAEEKVADAYAEMGRILQDKFNAYRQEYYEQNEDEDLYGSPANDYAIERLREELGDEFPYDIEMTGAGDVYFTFPYEEDEDMRKWSDKLGVEYNPQAQIEDIRLGYTTDGLTNKREIALTVPTIDSWNEGDLIHFGDAGEGRAVAWIRFGETEVPTAEYKLLLDEMDRLKEVAREL